MTEIMRHMAHDLEPECMMHDWALHRSNEAWELFKALLEAQCKAIAEYYDQPTDYDEEWS